MRSGPVSAFIMLCFCVSFAGAEAFRLKDGSILYGDVVGRSDSGIVIRTAHLGDLRIDPGALACTGDAALAGASCPVERFIGDPEDEALFFLTTAYTPPKNSASFRDIELLFMNLAYSPSAATAITGGFLFPISPEAQVLTAGVKQRILHVESDSTQTAVAVSGNVSKPYGDVFNENKMQADVNMMFSHRVTTALGPYPDGAGIHAKIGYLWRLRRADPYGYPQRTPEHWASDVSFGCGAEIRFTSHVKLMAEFVNTPPISLGDNVDGLFTFGLRLHGAKLAADIAGIRPLTKDDLNSLIAYPLLTVSYRIGN